MVKIRWLGAAGLEITAHDQTVLIDPYLSRIGKGRLLFSSLASDKEAVTGYLQALPGGLAGIIAGHTHFDHVLDIPEIAAQANCPVIGSRSLEALLAIHGLPGRVTPGENGTPVVLSPDISVEMIPSAHGRVLFGRIPCPGDITTSRRPPLKMSEYRLGDVYMPKITIGSTVFMHAGSANLIESELRDERCDVLFMCVPGWKKVPAYTTDMLRQLQPHTVVPFHFDDFTKPLVAGEEPPMLPFLNRRGFLKAVAESLPHTAIRIPFPMEALKCPG